MLFSFALARACFFLSRQCYVCPTMQCSSSELFPGMLTAAHSGSYQAARTGLKLADPPQCLVLPGEPLRLDLNSCKPHLTSVEFHSGILFRKNFESSVHPRLEKIPGDGKLFTHCSIKHLCLHQRHVNWKFADYLCFAESVQAWSSWLSASYHFWEFSEFVLYCCCNKLGYFKIHLYFWGGRIYMATVGGKERGCFW